MRQIGYRAAMLPFLEIDCERGHGTTLRLYQRGDEFSIRVDRQGELMNSRQHNSEDVLAELACAKLNGKKPRLLVGGLGMGFTLRAALNHAPVNAQVVVAELMEAVVRWNRDHLGVLAGSPLEDPRVDVQVADVGKVMRDGEQSFDAIMMDVDNGPDAFTCEDNDSLYGYPGLYNAYDALKPGGILTVWSSGPDRCFTQRMMKVGFDVKEQRVHARTRKRGDRHNIWIGTRPGSY